MSSTTSNNSSQTARITTGEYAGKVTNIIVIPFGDRPVIFTTIGLPDQRHVTHAVRLHNVDAMRIGLNELRSGFPNKLGALDDKTLIKALKNNAIKGDDVTALVVPQLKNGIPVKLDNNEAAYNIRLRSVEPMSDDVLDASLDRVFAAAEAEKAKKAKTDTEENPFAGE